MFEQVKNYSKKPFILSNVNTFQSIHGKQLLPRLPGISIFLKMLQPSFVLISPFLLATFHIANKLSRYFNEHIKFCFKDRDKEFFQESFQSLVLYFKLLKKGKDNSFLNWVIKNFGKRLEFQYIEILPFKKKMLYEFEKKQIKRI